MQVRSMLAAIQPPQASFTTHTSSICIQKMLAELNWCSSDTFELAFLYLQVDSCDLACTMVYLFVFASILFLRTEV